MLLQRKYWFPIFFDALMCEYDNKIGWAGHQICMVCRWHRVHNLMLQSQKISTIDDFRKCAQVLPIL